MTVGGYLLDTNIVSELRRKRPEPKLLQWFEAVDDDQLYLSVLTTGEIRRGISRVKDPEKQKELSDWLEITLLPWLGSHLLSVDRHVADVWGNLCGIADRPLPTIDSLLAATAMAHHLALVTRNTSDFQFPELPIINPWDSNLR